MPSSYAHYRLGQEVRKNVKEQAKKVMEAYPELFQIGLHGPDILFYFKPLGKNAVNQTGYGMHDWAGERFFRKAAEIVKKQNCNPAYLSYVYGFICHFALDVTCHAYIEEKIQASGISHAEIEVEFDRELMLRDGLDPIRQKLTGHIVPSENNAKVIQSFFPAVTFHQVKKALQGMIFYCDFLVAPSKFKRKLIYTGLKLAGCYDSMHGQIVNYKKSAACVDSTEKLIDFYPKAECLAVQLINEYGEFLEGKIPLNEIYRYDFGGILKEREEHL